MAVTEQDIVDNAAQIAALVNGAPQGQVEINELPSKVTIVSGDLGHMQDSEDTLKDKKFDFGLLIKPKDNDAAIVAPTVNDDSDDGYSTFSQWLDTVLSKVWVCLNPAVGAAVWVDITASGGAGGDFLASFPAGSLDYPVSNFAEFNIDTGTNGSQRRELFDDTTEEFIESDFTLPEVIAGTVTFEVYGFANTAVASKNIALKLYHSAKADGENWDAAYSSKESGDLAIDSTQDQLDKFTWTETVATLGWTAGDKVRIKLSRIAPSVNNLSGDYGMCLLIVRVPRA